MMPYSRQIECDQAAICAAIGDALHQPAAFDLTLRHADDPSDEQAPLTAVAIAPR